jgi:hypothetical protein
MENENACKVLGEKCFDEWWVFHGYAKEKSIEDFSKSKNSIKDFVDMLSFFYFASCKERWQPISSNQVQVSFHFFFLVFVFTMSFTC